MDQCSEWCTRKRARLIVFWVVANLFLLAVAYPLNWKFGVVGLWSQYWDSLLVKNCCSVALTTLLQDKVIAARRAIGMSNVNNPLLGREPN